jgi:WD40 repeat protein
LGAILYECLTGRPPFKAASPLDTISQVVKDEPVCPSQLQSKTPRDLETICLKCLQKDPARRYDSANALADDLGRFQRGEPIAARPVGRLERGWRWCRRNPVVATLSALLVVLGTVGFTAVTLLWLGAEAARKEANERAAAEATARKNEETARKDEEKARKTADEQRKRAEVTLYFNSIRQAAQSSMAGNAVLAQRVLDDCRLDLRGLEWRLLQHGLGGLALDKLDTAVPSLAFSHDGKRVATAGTDRLIRIHDAVTGKLLKTLPAQPGGVLAVAFHPGGRLLATASTDAVVRLWDSQTGKEERTLQGHNDPVLALAFSPDGRYLLSGSKDFLGMLWPLDPQQGSRALGGHSGEVVGVAFSPNSEVSATASHDGTIKLWESRTGKLLRTLRGNNSPVVSVAFMPRGDRLVSATTDGSMTLWETTSGKSLRVLRGSRGAAILTPDGTRIASAGDGSVQIWDPTTGQEILSLRGPAGCQPASLAFSPDGTRLGVGWANSRKPGTGEVRVYDASPPPGRFAVRPAVFSTQIAGLSPSGGLLVTGGVSPGFRTSLIQIWDTKTALEVVRMEGHAAQITCLAFRPDGKQFATGSADRSVMIWDVESGQNVQILPAHAKGLTNVAYSPDGKRLAARSADGSIRLHDLAQGQTLWTQPGYDPSSAAMAFSPDGKLLGAETPRGELLFLNAETGEPSRSLKDVGRVLSIAFHPDGKKLATAGPRDAIRLWDVSTGRVDHTWQTRETARQVRFNQSGSELSALDAKGRIQVWSVEGGRSLRTEPAAAGIAPVAIHDRFLLTAEESGRIIRVWDRPRP